MVVDEIRQKMRPYTINFSWYFIQEKEIPDFIRYWSWMEQDVISDLYHLYTDHSRYVKLLGIKN